MAMEETGTGHGIRITHETEAGELQTVEAHYNESGTHRLDLIIDGHNVYLTMGEAGYFLAWMATWYEQGEVHVTQDINRAFQESRRQARLEAYHAGDQE